MSSIQIYEQKDFTGGLNLRSDQFQLADNESPEMLNVEVDPRGGVFSRGGMRRININNVSGTWNPQKLTPFYGSVNKLMLANSTKVYHLKNSNFEPLSYSNGNNIIADSPHGACIASWGNDMYIATGTGSTSTNTYKWDGNTQYATAVVPITQNADWSTTNNPISRFPRCEHIAVHANKMWAADTIEEGVSYPNRVRWSNDSQAENWIKSNSFDILGGGRGITGMVVVNGALIIFKPYAIYAVYGYDDADFRLIEISTSIGCASHHSMIQTETGVYFYATHKGLHFFDGSNLVDLFEPMRPVFDFGFINSAAAEAVSVSWLGRKVWLSLPYSNTGSGATEATINMVYDPSMRSYTMFKTADGYGVVGGTDFRESDGTEYSLMCHPVVPCVLKVNDYDYSWDEISAINTQQGFSTVYRTKWFDAGSFLQRKMFRRPDLVMRETETIQTINVKVYHNYQEAYGTEAREFDIVQQTTSEGLVWDEDNWAFEPVGQDPYGEVWSADILGGTIQTAKNLGLCKSVQLRFSGEAKKPWGINSIGYKWAPRRVKG